MKTPGFFSLWIIFISSILSLFVLRKILLYFIREIESVQYQIRIQNIFTVSRQFFLWRWSNIMFDLSLVNWGCIFITKTDVSHKCSSLLFDLGNANSKLCCFVYVIHSNTKMTVFTLNLWILLITNFCIIYNGKLIIRFFFYWFFPYNFAQSYILHFSIVKRWWWGETIKNNVKRVVTLSKVNCSNSGVTMGRIVWLSAWE